MPAQMLFKIEIQDDAAMNVPNPKISYLASNVQFLMEQRGLKNAQELADASGVSYTTCYRALNEPNYHGGARTIDQLATYFGVTTDALRWRDLRNDPLHKREMVHIRVLDGFELPKGPLYERYQWLDDPIALPKSWFAFHVGIDPDRARCAFKRTKSNTGELDIGSIAFIDLDATDVDAWGPGLYAFTYHNTSDIKRITVPRAGALRISGSKESEDTIELEGKELEGFVIHGRVITKITPASA